jgi:hypothetical protein
MTRMLLAETERDQPVQTLLPHGPDLAFAQGVCEAATVMALSLHALYDLFCRDFRAADGFHCHNAGL